MGGFWSKEAEAPAVQAAECAVAPITRGLAAIPAADSDQATSHARHSHRALVVGINKYSRSPLRCCVNDAKEVHAALRRMGFDCVLELDCNAEAFRRVIRTFCGSLQPDDVVFFYFA
eukprot:811958-Prymnesium_polylepis.1